MDCYQSGSMVFYRWLEEFPRMDDAGFKAADRNFFFVDQLMAGRLSKGQ